METYKGWIGFFSFFPLIPGLQCLRKFASYLWVVFVDLCTQFNLKVQNQRLWASLQAGEVGSASQQALEYLKSLLSTVTTEQARHPTAEAECFWVHGHDKQEEETRFLLIPETLVWILHQVLKGGWCGSQKSLLSFALPLPNTYTHMHTDLQEQRVDCVATASLEARSMIMLECQLGLVCGMISKQMMERE